MLNLTRIWQFITLANQGGLVARWKSLRWYSKLCLGLALIYVLDPVDFIPDVVPLIGQLDDVFVITSLITLALQLSPAPVADPLVQNASSTPRPESDSKPR